MPANSDGAVGADQPHNALPLRPPLTMNHLTSSETPRHRHLRKLSARHGAEWPQRSPLNAAAAETYCEKETERPGVIASRATALQKRTVLNSVNAAPTYQIQLLGTFLHTKYPSFQAQSSIRFRHSFLHQLPSRDLVTEPLLRHAVATLSCSHIGCDFKDGGMVAHAKESYNRTLSLLIRHMNGKSQHDHRTVLTAMLLLALSDEVSTSREQNAWMTHYEGAEIYFKTNGKQCLDARTPFDIELFGMFQGPATMMALAQRKSSFLSGSQLLACKEFLRLRDDFHSSIILQGIRVSELVERTEFCIAQPFTSGTKKLWDDLVGMHGHIQDMLTKDSAFNREMTREEADLIHTSDLEAFDMEIEEHCLISGSPTLRSHFRFSHWDQRAPIRNLLFTLWWMHSLIVDCMILRLLHFHPCLRRHVPDDFQRSAFFHATQLCRSFQYLSRSQLQGDVIWLQVLCSLAQNFFEEVSAFPEYGWCQSLGIATKTRLARLVATQPLSLCRLRGLHEGLSNLSRFRMAPIFSEPPSFDGNGGQSGQSSRRQAGDSGAQRRDSLDVEKKKVSMVAYQNLKYPPDESLVSLRRDFLCRQVGY